MRLQPESDATAIEWSRIRGKKLQGDLLVTGNQTGIDFHQGTIDDVSDQKVRFTLEGNTLGVKRAKVYGLVYYHAAGAPAAESPYTIVDADGSRWITPTLKLDGDKIEFTAPGGRAVCRSLDRIAQIDLSCGKIVFLSDLTPDSEKFAPFPFTLTEKELPSRMQFSRVRRDENAESRKSPQESTARSLHKGLATASPAAGSECTPGHCRPNSAACRRLPESTTTSARWAMFACEFSATAKRSWILV